MKYLKLVLPLLLLSLFLNGCCRSENNPPLPSGTSKGWTPWTIRGTDVQICGDFVLHKGESVNDRNVGIEVVELFPAKCGLLNHPPDDIPQARLRFFRVSDQKTLYEVTQRRGTGFIITEMDRRAELPWQIIDIVAINSQEGWIDFNLRMCRR